MPRSLILACLTLLPLGCGGDGTSDSPSVSVSDADGVLHVRVAALTPDDVAQWRTEEIHSTASRPTPVELYQVTAARFLEDGRLAVANAGTSEILMLDAAGALQSRTGRQGEGPGEFAWISGLDIDTAGRLLAYDPRHGRLTRYDADGRVAGTHTLAPPSRVVDLLPLTVLADGRLAAVYGEMRVFARSGEKRDTTPLMLFGADGATADTLGHWPATEWAFISFSGGASRSQPGFGRSAAHAGRNGRFAIGSNDSLDISVFDRDGRLVMRITGASGGPVEAGDVNRWRARLTERWADGPDEIRRALDGVPHRATYPAFEELVVDDAGRVWIGSYVRPDGAERHWLVIGIDGRPAGRLSLPASAQVLDVAADHIALLGRDELDEEHVSVLSVVPAVSER